MKGINNQPFINLDPYINIDEFINLRYKIYNGLSKCKYIVSNYFRTDVEFLESSFSKKLHDYVGNILIPMNTVHEKIMSLSDKDEMKIQYSKLNSEEKRSYLKFVGASQPYWSHYLFIDGKWTDDCQHFPELVDWIKQLPFTSISLVQFYIVDSLNPTVVHKDVFIKEDETHSREFVWLNITPGKNFYIYDHLTNEKFVVNSNSCFFNERDFHGGDPINQTTVSLKIWGKFTDAIKNKLSLRGEY
jgi:hypothetical protein